MTTETRPCVKCCASGYYSSALTNWDGVRCDVCGGSGRIVVEAPAQAELAAATEARDRILDQLAPYNADIEHGDGWYARAHRVRHDQLLRKLELAEDRMARAQAELTAPTLPSALLA